MKVIALALAFIALSLASANATHRYHHHWRHHSSMGARYNPNGTAGGPTTLSGTGSSQFGGSSPPFERSIRRTINVSRALGVCSALAQPGKRDDRAT